MLTNLASLGMVNPGVTILGVNLRMEHFFGLVAFTIFLVILLVLMLGMRMFNRSSVANQLAAIQLPATEPQAHGMDAVLNELNRETSVPVPSYASEYIPREVNDDRELVLRAFQRRQTW